MSAFRVLTAALFLASAWTAEQIPATTPPPSTVPAAVRTSTPVAKPEDRWQQHHASLVQFAHEGKVKIAFFGDSITHYWTEPGAELWKSTLLPMGAADFGIGGDKCEHILWRLQNGELEGMKPAVIVLMAGTNNLWDYELKPMEIASGIATCAETIRKQQPQAKLLLMGVIPQGRLPTDRMRKKIIAINAILAALPASSYDAFLDLGPKLLTEDGTFPERFSADQTHLTAEGYAVWLAEMQPILDRFLSK
jgi:lysophospholipase L1-like esterase